MIIIGYPGIGKSTLAGRDRRYIDLESSLFKIDGKRSNDWYKTYCRVAEGLSKQGYIVFVSSHSAVRKALEASDEIVAAVYPDATLADEWVDKLKARADESNIVKDINAYIRARCYFYQDINELKNCDIPYLICLSHMNYDLEASIIHFINRDLSKVI